jgi:hypothetical protein
MNAKSQNQAVIQKKSHKNYSKGAVAMAMAKMK